MFVANRVGEIQSLTPPSSWHQCPGHENPADLVSRGVLGDQIVSSKLWMCGPSWLAEPLSISIRETESFCTNEESKTTEALACVTVHPTPPMFESERWGDFSKVQRVVAWVLRYAHNCTTTPDNKISGPLSAKELGDAKVKMFYHSQRDMLPHEVKAVLSDKPLPKGSTLSNLDPFLDDKGLLRIRGRLENAELSFACKHPIIIPNCHLAKLLVKFHHLFLQHAGVSTIVSTVRESFWIIGIRRVAKSVNKECVRCQRHDSRACSQPAAPLPELRVKAATPFTVTGLDFAGPLFCSDFPSKKLYILLFTCAVVRAIHLEPTDSMSVEDCMLALRRFTARRGLPSMMYSDNAKTFVACSGQIQKVYGHISPHWKFIVPRSPWWGGWWERLIRSVKSAIRKTLSVKYSSRS